MITLKEKIDINFIMDEFFAELERACLKFPEWPEDPIHAAGILNEEAGETMRAALDFYYLGGGVEKIKKEASQAGAMAMRLLLNIEKYKTKKGA